MQVNCFTHPTIEAIGVCHHCGKPICKAVNITLIGVNERITKDQLCGYSINDPAFSDVVPANHCESCLTEHHSEFLTGVQRIKAGL